MTASGHWHGLTTVTRSSFHETGTRSPRFKSCNRTSAHHCLRIALFWMVRLSASTVRAGPGATTCFSCFFVFDVLFVNGQDMRRAQLSDRKHELRGLLAQLPIDSRLRYADHIETFGTRLFQQVCSLDLEGIVAKQRFSPYTSDREISTWYKIRNPRYSHVIGREFDRERHDEPVAGWHRCTLATLHAEAH